MLQGIKKARLNVLQEEIVEKGCAQRLEKLAPGVMDGAGEFVEKVSEIHEFAEFYLVILPLLGIDLPDLLKEV
jgi:hypothetical protein